MLQSYRLKCRETTSFYGNCNLSFDYFNHTEAVRISRVTLKLMLMAKIAERVFDKTWKCLKFRKDYEVKSRNWIKNNRNVRRCAGM